VSAVSRFEAYAFTARMLMMCRWHFSNCWTFNGTVPNAGSNM